MVRLRYFGISTLRQLAPRLGLRDAADNLLRRIWNPVALLRKAGMLRTRPDVLAKARCQATQFTGAKPVSVEPWNRFLIRMLFFLIGTAFAIHLLLPQMGGLHQTWHVLRLVRWEWLAAGVFVVPLTYFAAAMALRGAVSHPLGLRRTALVQLAGSFVNKLTPKGVGGMGVNERYLERSGVERPVAVAGIALNKAAGLVVHVTSLIAVSALLGSRCVDRVNLPKTWPFLVALVVVIALLGIIGLGRSPDTRRKVTTSVVTATKGLLDVLRTPAQAVELLCGVAGVTVANVLTLTVALHAFGAHTSLLTAGAVYLGGAALASASPTPGNLGAIEAALVSNLTTLGVQADSAVAGVLVYRLLAFWLPIIPGFLALRYLQHRQVL
jgi:uncharacterized membrane protein YbhN (UPF0104 family)